MASEMNRPGFEGAIEIRQKTRIKPALREAAVFQIAFG